MNLFSSFVLEATLTPWQIAGCIALSVVCIGVILFLLFRKPYRAPKPEEAGAPDSLVGARAVVTETVDGDAGTGLVEINGEGWAARSVYTDDVYEVGTEVSIVAVEGAKVIVKSV